MGIVAQLFDLAMQQVYGEYTRQLIDTLHYIVHTVATREAGGHFGTPRTPLRVIPLLQFGN